MSESTHKQQDNAENAPTSSKGNAAVPVWRRLLPALIFSGALFVLLAFSYGQDATPVQLDTEARYAAAKEVFARLKSAKETEKSQWANLSHEFYAIYAGATDWPNRPAALFRSALVLEGLGERHKDMKGYMHALERYAKMVQEFSSSRLADDALLRMAYIQGVYLDNRPEALRILTALHKKYPKGDMRPKATELGIKLRGKDQPLAPHHTASKNRQYSPAVLKNTASTSEASLTQVSWATLDAQHVQITIGLDKYVPWKVVEEKDKRFVVVMDKTKVHTGVKKGSRVQNSMLTEVSLAPYAKDSTALYLDFSKPTTISAKVAKNPFRIIVTVAAKQEANSVATVKNTVSMQKNKPPQPAQAKVTAQNKTKTKPVAAAVKNKPAKKPTPNKVQAIPSKAAVKARVEGAQFTDMALQLGLELQTVYLDVGHGGRDPGAVGNGVVEREVVLDIGKRVGKMLEKQGLKVVYSRTKDIAVPLSARSAKANASSSDIFVSLHVNANADTSVHGFETYYLDFAKTKHAVQVAVQENATSDRSLGEIQSLLTKVVENVRTKESSALATQLQQTALQSMKQQGFSVKNGGTRAAPFHVLIGAHMPAVLVEVGYCTHKKEAGLLQRDDYRQALALGIANGILAYKKHLQQGAAELFALTKKGERAM